MARLLADYLAMASSYFLKASSHFLTEREQRIIAKTARAFAKEIREAGSLPKTDSAGKPLSSPRKKG